MEYTELNAKAAWCFWAEVIEQPGSLQYVRGINSARFELHRILTLGFPKQMMHDWLLKWPNERGAELFREKCCKNFGVAQKIARHKKPASVTRSGGCNSQD